MSPSLWRHATGQRRARRSWRGQSLVEFALVVPVLLILVAGAIDFGRAFYGWITIENAAKEGAMYGARNPRCDTTKTGCASSATVSYSVNKDLSGLTGVSQTVSCVAPDQVTVRDLNANNGPTICREGDTYRVAVRYPFRLITPILASIVGQQLTIASTSTAMVLVDAFDPTATAPPTPPSGCTSPNIAVPDLTKLKVGPARTAWQAAGFTGTFTPPSSAGVDSKNVKTQSLAPDVCQPPTAAMTVTW